MWVHTGSEFLRWTDIMADPELMARVKYARIKSVRRAVEKIYRSYEGNVSRLLDCCRQVRSG